VADLLASLGREAAALDGAALPAAQAQARRLEESAAADERAVDVAARALCAASEAAQAGRDAQARAERALAEASVLVADAARRARAAAALARDDDENDADGGDVGGGDGGREVGNARVAAARRAAPVVSVSARSPHVAQRLSRKKRMASDGPALQGPPAEEEEEEEDDEEGEREVDGGDGQERADAQPRNDGAGAGPEQRGGRQQQPSQYPHQHQRRRLSSGSASDVAMPRTLPPLARPAGWPPTASTSPPPPPLPRGPAAADPPARLAAAAVCLSARTGALSNADFARALKIRRGLVQAARNLASGGSSLFHGVYLRRRIWQSKLSSTSQHASVFAGSHSSEKFAAIALDDALARRGRRRMNADLLLVSARLETARFFDGAPGSRPLPEGVETPATAEAMRPLEQLLLYYAGSSASSRKAVGGAGAGAGGGGRSVGAGAGAGTSAAAAASRAVPASGGGGGGSGFARRIAAVVPRNR